MNSGILFTALIVISMIVCIFLLGTMFIFCRDFAKKLLNQYRSSGNNIGSSLDMDDEEEPNMIDNDDDSNNDGDEKTVE